jgi:hypothetical protein
MRADEVRWNAMQIPELLAQERLMAMSVTPST